MTVHPDTLVTFIIGVLVGAIFACVLWIWLDRAPRTKIPVPDRRKTLNKTLKPTQIGALQGGNFGIGAYGRSDVKAAEHKKTADLRTLADVVHDLAKAEKKNDDKQH